jgi:hypothetical protein
MTVHEVAERTSNKSLAALLGKGGMLRTTEKEFHFAFSNE